MANGDDIPVPVDEVVLTNEGALSPEEFERRRKAAQEVGGLGAPERVDDVALLQQERERVEEETHGDLSGITDTILRQGAAGATLGASNLFLSRESRERARLQNRTNATTAALSEIGGGLAPSLLTGGAGTAGTLARLTPAGRVAALAGRVSSGGRGLAGRVVSGAAAGAIEGAAQGVGNFIAREALEEDRDFSGQALVANAGLGGLLGGAAGGIGVGLGAVVQRVRRGRRGPATAVEEFDTAAREALEAPSLARQAGEPLLQRPSLSADDAFFQPRRTGPVRRQAARRQAEGLQPTADDIFDRPILAPRDSIPFDEIVSAKTQRGTRDAWGDLVGNVDDRGAQAFAAQAEDIPRLIDDLDAIGIDVATRTEAQSALSRSATDYLEASTAARKWATDVMDEVGAVDLARISPEQLAKELPDALEDRGALVLAQLDEAANDYTTIQTELSSAMTEALEESATAGVEAAPGLAQRTTGRIRALLSGDTVTTAVGAVETAREFGVDIPLPSVRDVPIIGDALSLYVRFKAGVNAGKRLGVLPSTPATRAAVTVNRTRSSITTAVSKVVASAVTRKLAVRTPAAVATQIALLRQETPEMVAARARDTFLDVPDMAEAAAATAARAHEYLTRTAPKNPFAGTPFPVEWQPTPDESLVWQRRADAVRDPRGAVVSTMTEPFPDLEAEALREVYPAIFELARAELMAKADSLVIDLPDHRLQALGRAYGVVLTVNQMPGYPRLVSRPAQPPPTPTSVTRGPGPTTAPSVTSELTEDQARARARA